MKVSEISNKEIADYLRLEIDDLTENEKTTITNLLDIAKSFIKSYTGLSDIDTHEDFVIVVYILVEDMYDNRTLYVDKNNLNKVVETVLGMHSTNLL
ncbi:head-tail connector protein [Aminipila terrae]|uniref:Phage gp6-like head-tail connector protein n=1 Tax=Aminipila terrae TaxID=2697030 RepID=A0A6P1MNU9_9FIRM|nr:head-tail connector protein [Aminipila terrae]QHI73788.1 phage gp6-like head-tail connector protein [Aminipila terrae]